MLIGDLALKSGFSRDTLRFYERQKLIRPKGVSRLGNNYRDYPEETLEQLVLIRTVKQLGFTLKEIKTLLQKFPANANPCGDLRAGVSTKIDQIKIAIRTLQKTQQDLEATLAACGPECGSGQGIPFCLPK